MLLLYVIFIVFSICDVIGYDIIKEFFVSIGYFWKVSY